MSGEIKISTNASADLSSFLKERSFTRLAVLTDENTAVHCYPLVKKSLPDHKVITVAAGEQNKTLTTCSEIWKAMTDQNLDRHSLMVVIGGGVLGDMGGFCAATYKRGIDFVLIPTTLLAQVDASIGGKLGIDFENFKNHIGVFQLPALTLIDSAFNKTLPPAEKRSGFAEIIKHVLISDRTLWNEITSKEFDSQNWERLVRHSIEFKSRVTGEDPKEKGLRKILNAGHTIGHAIETHLLSTDRKVMHGEAVAAGLVVESYISVKKGMLKQQEFESISEYVLKTFGKVGIVKADIESVVGLVRQDKKNQGDKVLCVLLEAVGKARYDVEITADEVTHALMHYLAVQI
jgi:3-dehydroquinate synthase